MRDAYLITMNELLVTLRNPFWLFRGLIQPMIYLLLFGPLLNGVAGTRGFPATNAIQFFAPGLLIMNALFSAGFEGFSLQDKVDSGFLERLRVTPISRLSLAMGFVLQSSVTLLIQSVVLIICSLFFGLRLDLLGTAALVILIFLIGVTMASFSFASHC
jgi:ABC-2 type transport system permease protein